MKLIVGLGNPGPKYVGTRHNVGFEVMDCLASRWGISLAGEKFHAWCGTGSVANERAVLLKPTTYMNLSGQAVLAAGRFYKLELDDLLVVSDDLALPLGAMRMRSAGSAGSHNGLQDVINRLGSNAWTRLRIGIGEPMGSATGHVLGRFDEVEAKTIDRVCSRAADAVECWVTDGCDLTMTRFNGEIPQ